jgi:hypothetical protein
MKRSSIWFQVALLTEDLLAQSQLSFSKAQSQVASAMGILRSQTTSGARLWAKLARAALKHDLNSEAFECATLATARLCDGADIHQISASKYLLLSGAPCSVIQPRLFEGSVPKHAKACIAVGTHHIF